MFANTFLLQFSSSHSLTCLVCLCTAVAGLSSHDRALAKFKDLKIWHLALDRKISSIPAQKSLQFQTIEITNSEVVCLWSGTRVNVRGRRTLFKTWFTYSFKKYQWTVHSGPGLALFQVRRMTEWTGQGPAPPEDLTFYRACQLQVETRAALFSWGSVYLVVVMASEYMICRVTTTRITREIYAVT